VLFSSRQIPGNELAIGRVQNLLAERGIEMVTDRQSDIHVSGHPGRPELQALYGWIRPEILVPVHGEIRHMQEQARLGRAEGIPHAVFQQNGDVVRLAPGAPGKIAHTKTGRLVLDGDIIVPADGEAIVTRRRIARDGMLIVALDAERRPHIHGFGLPLDEDYAEFVEEAERDVAEALKRLKGPKARDREEIVGRQCGPPRRATLVGQEAADQSLADGRAQLMRWYSLLAIYFLVWVVCAFVVMPFGIKTHEEAGHDKIPGQADSAPANFRPLKVILRATVLSLAICALLVLNYRQGWITREDLDVFGEPQGFSSGVG